MKKLKFPAVISTVLFLPVLLLQSVYAQSDYPVEIKYQPTQVKISKVKINSVSDNIHEYKELRGVVKRRTYNSHALPGHIDYIVLSNKDEILHKGIIQVPGLNLRRNRYGRQFNILLPTTLPEDSHIKIGWHKTQNSILANVSPYP